MPIKIDLAKMVAEAGANIQSFVEKGAETVVKAVDQNGDGKLDLSDIQTVGERVQSSFNEAKRNLEREQLKPIFPQDIDSPDFILPKMIRVTHPSKPHIDSEVCKGCIGYYTESGDMKVLNIYRSFVERLGLSFYPTLDEEVYYVDPTDRDHYIVLDDYFTYLKEARINELQRIAQALGAKHFRVIYKEKKKSVTSKDVRAGMTVKIDSMPVEQAEVVAKIIKMPLDQASLNISHNEKNTELAAMSIAAEMEFPGHAPIKPELVYLKKEISINNLVALRMDSSSPLQHQTVNIEMSHSSGIKIKDAAKIDAALKVMKISGEATITSEAQDETRKVLEYEIDF